MTVFAVLSTFTPHYSGDSEADYVMFFRSSRNSSEMDFGDNEDSGNEDNADTPRPSMSDIQVIACNSVYFTIHSWCYCNAYQFHRKLKLA